MKYRMPNWIRQRENSLRVVHEGLRHLTGGDRIIDQELWLGCHRNYR